ncbi:WecB/TagA/CpsF family glycosyltransferase [Spirosoma oryzicola]|uniref:WecB/TagA/CpsF family glycosyltransferase n=1 Tax=Spirosoma oryzicola TaxID=2898794 RepID=UPI001E2F0D7F|nr:WecB/TagA/CpsF family glycosyltransferase [Spirosoma oryzicola]UHG93164.1 WecB/TagA/CpsF family glycosyltransferase [Spirosoma oryzicola]
MVSNPWATIIGKVKNFEIVKGITSFVNPYSMLVLKNNPTIATNIDHWHVDGISLVKTVNKHESKKINRFSFDDTSLAPIVFNFIKERKLTLAIVGSTQVNIIAAVAIIEKKYSIKVNYFSSGYFDDLTQRQEVLNHIHKNNFDFVICGMGTPHQEKFLIDLKMMGWSGYGFTCGGYLHQIAKKENYYPKLFDSLNIRWVFRIIDEPKLIKRYFYLYPKFFIEYRLRHLL